MLLPDTFTSHPRPAHLVGNPGISDAAPGLEAEIIAHGLVSLFEMAARLVLTDPDRYRPYRFIDAIAMALGLAGRGS